VKASGGRQKIVHRVHAVSLMEIVQSQVRDGDIVPGCSVVEDRTQLHLPETILLD